MVAERVSRRRLGTRLPRFSAEAERQIRRLHLAARGSSVRDDMTTRVLRSHLIGPCVVTGPPATFLAEEPLRQMQGFLEVLLAD